MLPKFRGQLLVETRAGPEQMPQLRRRLWSAQAIALTVVADEQGKSGASLFVLYAFGNDFAISAC